AGVNVRDRLASGHALGSHRIVPGDDRCSICGGEGRQRGSHPRQARLAMDMSEQRLHAWDQGLAVEQLADRDSRVERGRIALAPGLRAKVSIEISGRGDAAGEVAAPRLEQTGFGRGEYRKTLR